MVSCGSEVVLSVFLCVVYPDLFHLHFGPFRVSQSSQYVLFEAASGYCLFEVVEVEEIGALKVEVQASVTDLSRFSKLVKLKAFQVCFFLLPISVCDLTIDALKLSIILIQPF